MNTVSKKTASQPRRLLAMEDLKSAAEWLKCAAHPHRLRIIEVLLQGERTVDELARLCELTQPATSGHLRLMESRGLLVSQRAGRTVYYAVAEPKLAAIIECIRRGGVKKN